MPNADFTSFQPSLFRFLKTLTANNNRAWFQQNKTRYEEQLLTPCQEFIRSFQPHLKRVSPHFLADDRRVGGSLMRIYRDTRFARDKTPYKTNVGIHFRHEMGKGRVLTSESDDLVGAFITGYLHLEETGIYHFQVTNNDGVRLQLGGARIYDDPRTGPARTSPPIPVDVMEPGWYALEIWYFEKRGTATLDILWSPPGDGDFIEVPITAMKHQ